MRTFCALWAFACLLLATDLYANILPLRDEVHSNDCAKNTRCSQHCFFHGDCLRNGSCLCDKGWSGENCTVPLCPNCLRGSCRTPGGSCRCSPGFTGPNCDVLVGGLPFTKPTCDMFGNCICAADGTPCTSGELPDLKPYKQASVPFVEWKLFPSCDCAVDEGCAKAGKRKLLRFTMETWNVGKADLFVGSPGDYVRQGDERYIWHQCHEHPHFVHWVQFLLRNKVTNETHIGWKSGSAIIDSKRVLRDPHVYSRRKYLDELQGLQVGWADWYPYWLDCQWIDITGVAPGDYQLEITVNPTHAIKESDYSNNMVVIPLECKYQCVHGKCDFGTGCICDPGWDGRSCEIPAPVKRCVPQCEDKSCGSDGCGGDCGLCSEREHCDPSTGSCICTPQCINKYCGDDGCGGECDRCPRGQICTDAFRCVDCVRNCTNRNCGSDGCGGYCGYCQDPFTCDVSGQCVCISECKEGDCGTDGCGGSCGSPKCGQSSCTPNCAGKECGSDGCGGHCGQGFDCLGTSMKCIALTGQCVCVPDCDDRECGPDGCGGSCGSCADWGTKCHNTTGLCTCDDVCGEQECGYNDCRRPCGDHHGLCPYGQQCQKNKCVCVPQCKGKQCGPDGCGDTCASCAEGYECNLASFRCECKPQCKGKNCGPDGCGGNCGSCSSTLLCSVQGQCTECIPDCDERQCGSNGCPSGNCGDCPEGSRCLNRWVCVGHDEVVPREEFKMVYTSPSVHHTKALPEVETREQKTWLTNMSALLGIPTGSIEVVSWEYFSVQGGGEMRKVYFYIYNTKVRTAVQSGAMLMDFVENQPNKLAEHGFNSVEVSHIRVVNSNGSTTFSGKMMFFFIALGVVVAIFVLLVLFVLLVRAIVKRNRQQRVTHVVLQPEMSRFLGDDIDDL